MGANQNSKVQGVEVECSDERVIFDKSEVFIVPTSFDVRKNVSVACQSHRFTDIHDQAVVFVEGSGVIRVGLSTIEPKSNKNFLKGSVFETEEGFENKDSVYRRVLYRSNGFFYFGHEGSEHKFDSENTETNLWLYIIYVYGNPEVSVQIYHDDQADEGDEIKLHFLDGTDSDASDHVDPNTVTFRASEGVVNGQIYRIQWDMRLNEENIPGSSPRPSHGYMKILLVSKSSRESESGMTLWEWSSGVSDFSFSSVIAFRVSLAKLSVTHNLLVNSVDKTQTDKLRQKLRKGHSMYLTIECSSGHINITHTNNGLVLQEFGSTLLVSDYPYQTGMSAADIMLEIFATLGFEPRRIQFGDSPTTFAVEFYRKLDQKEINTFAEQLGISIKPLQQTKTVQVICTNNENFEDESELIMNFSDRRIGGGRIDSVERDKTDPYCWLITFKNKGAPRRLWMSKVHRIKTGNKEIKTIVLPWYKELGLAINKGELPNYDKSPLTVIVDRTKLSFILKNEKEKENFVRAITNKVNVKVKFSKTKKPVDILLDDDDDDHDDDEEGEMAEDSVTFGCLIEDSDLKQLLTWKYVCQKEVQLYFDNHLHKKELKIQDEQWEKALDFLQNNSEGRQFYYENNEETCTLLLVASNAKVIDKEADSIRRFLNMTKEISRIVQIDSKYYTVLDAERMLDKIRSKCPNIAMKVNRDTGIVSFKGPEDEVDKAETEVLRLATGIRTISFPVNGECEKFLNTVNGKEAVEKIFKNRYINPDFIVSGNEIKIHVYAISDVDIDQKKRQIKRIIEEKLKCYMIEGNERKTLKGHPWEVCKKKVIKDCGPLVIIDDKNAVKVYGTLTAVEDAQKEIEKYMKQYRKEQESIRVSIEVAQFLENSKIYDNKVECLKDSTGNLTGKVCIHGTASEVTKLTNTIKTDMKSINAHWFHLNKKWVASLAEEFLQTYQQSEELMLQIEYGQSLAAQGITGVAVLSNLGVIIQVRKGDITLETTHVIVNPVTGDKKSFDKGLGAYISYKGGEEIKLDFMEKHRQHEVSEQRKLEEKRKQEAALAEAQAQMNTNGVPAVRREDLSLKTSFDFPVGEMILTGSGSLRCMNIMHVVAPPWVQGDPSAERHMKMFVNKVLQKCDDLGLTSVSIPLLVCRNSPYPIEKAASYIMEAVAEYITKGSSKIKEIIMCDTSKGAINEFTKAFGKLQGQWFVFQHGLDITVEDLISSSIRRSGNSQNTFKLSTLRPGSTLSQHSQHLDEDNDQKGLDRPGSSNLRWRGNSQPVRSEVMYERLPEETSDTDGIFDNGFPFNIPISDSMKLHVKKGDLTKETVDVVVCTTPEFPDLKGEVAKAVLSAGGENILQECKTLGNIKEGELRATGPGQLPCRKIFHVLIPKKWNEKSGEQFVYQVVSMCLYEAAKQSNTIAFPVIGSGNTGFPPDIVARAMVRAIRDFDRSNSSITDVSLVIYSKADAVAKAFEQTLPKLFKKTHSNAGERSHISQKMSGSKHQPRGSKSAYAPPASFSKHSKVDDVVIVKVISKNKGKYFQKQIEQFVEKEYMTKTLNFKDLTNESTLTAEEEKEILYLSNKFGIEIEIDKKSCNITLRGIRERVSNCEITAVQLLQTEFKWQRFQQRNVERIANAEQWFYDDGGRSPVEQAANYEIYHGHMKKEDFCYHKNGIKYNVHYIAEGEMEQWPSNDPQKKMRLVRPKKQAQAGEDMPSNWTLNNSKENKAQVPLAEHEAEFSEVKKKFFDDFDGQKPTQIIKITRVEDRFKWKEYQIKKKNVELRNPQAENEKRLWHGTGADTVDKIIGQGYDRGFSNVAVYGRGVYFAAKSSYSDRDAYAKPDANLVKRMFLNRVLTGVYCVGNQNLQALPDRPGYTFEGCPVPYDSAVDTLQNPGIFVIFNDTQFYPEYLIEYKK